MLGQAKNNKGLNLLELVVVIAIVGFMSAIAYPNFSSWNKERKIRAAVKEVASLVRNAIMQTERGTFGYVQVLFSNSNGELEVTSRGMTMASLITRMNDSTDPWNTAPEQRCVTAEGTGDDAYWDTDKPSTSNEIKNAVYTIKIRDVTTNFSGERAGAICFAKNGKFYEGAEALAFDEATAVPFNFINICRRTNNIQVCDVDATPGVEGDICPNSDITLSRVHWNRFGNVVTSRYVNYYELNQTTGDKEWKCPNQNDVIEYKYD